MTEIGYTLSAEEHPPQHLIEHARRAEEVGFDFLSIADHYHPWVGRQGNAPFVWSVLGALSQVTSRIPIATGVTCPIIRVHPAVVAHAAATVTAMMPGRFVFGVGTGENLNEHILGTRWPPADVRLEMLEEAIEIIRRLWTGKEVNHRGRWFEVENARIYTLPPEPPPLLVAAKGEKAAELAGRVGDGLFGTSPQAEMLKVFDEAGGSGKPRYGQLHVCWAEDEAVARATAYEWWPNTSLEGEMTQELPLPRHFEQAAKLLREDDVAENVVCGPDPERHLEAIRAYVEAGYDHVYVHQVGPDQEGFFRFYGREVLPKAR